MHKTPLDVLLSQIEAKYKVEVTDLRIGDETLKIAQLADFEGTIEKLVEQDRFSLEDLPLWAKVWESSFVLASFLGKQQVLPDRRILEIGAGLGVVGVYAAVKGHRVTISDMNDDALLFARANVLLNGCQDRAEVRRIDWTSPHVPTPYPMIVGSEVLYDRESYPVLVGFLDEVLAPGGTIFLTKNKQLKAPGFFAELVKTFGYKEKVIRLRGPEDEIEVGLYAVRRKAEI
ncbi:class I SAM-dependent methyltransferase [Desulfacinum hydrothermale]|uniref:class I SAM-dependent methyltransferase n=1 Tax=Desulfacinum hydrothermale TaxID=109258 RepID=UPI0014830D0B|nr:methyltransferase [Desulfacinum hydrothermale]